MNRRMGLALAVLALSACAPQSSRLAHAPAAHTPEWVFQTSDVPVDPAYQFGRLANGMHYVIRHNATPSNMVLVRLQVHAGALDESEAERGYAHFVEHMAFQGSTHVPEGEMVRLLERNGLAFGADTNASTGYDYTTYQLDLPRNDTALVDTALMLMRETVSELAFPADAVARERGVVLAEKRDRNNWQFREMENRLAFIDPAARYTHRMPIGTAGALDRATSQNLKAFWRREYVPAKTTLIVIGDIDPAALETEIKARFSDWPAAPSPPQPDPGPVAFHDADRTSIYLDPALSDRITASRHGPWKNEPDTLAQRREDLLRHIGYSIVNRRLQHLSRRPDPPFRDAGFGSGDVFRSGRTTNIVIDGIDAHWRPGLVVAAQEYRRALAGGFTRAEVAEQVANIRIAAEHAAAAANTRSDDELLKQVFALLRDDTVPTPPADALARLRAFIPEITPEAALAALKRDAIPLDRPLIRFQGRMLPEGGEKAIRTAWNEAMRAPLPPVTEASSSGFAYTDFGPAGTVVADRVEPDLGIREIRFANGVRLNLKHTDLEKDRVLVEMNIDGGQMLETLNNPLATEMVPMLTTGGLGKHSLDELQTLLAGHQVSTGLATRPETFMASAHTTPADLALQLELMGALITDPGYRPEGELQYHLAINNYFAQLNATPGSTLANAIGGILADNDPRFALQKADAYRALTFDKLKHDISDRLTHGAIEIGIVGDVDEDKAIALVGRTLGALPTREADFRPYDDQRQRPFTKDHSSRILHHTGPADQAMLRYTWATRDDTDPVEKQVLNMLGRVAQIEITENLRQKLGKAYSPGASSNPSQAWKGYGTFSVTASVDVDDVGVTREAILDTIAALRNRPVNADIMLRARQPLLESFENSLKTNDGWLALVARAQSEPDRIDRHMKAIERLVAVTPADVEAAARRYLGDSAGVPVTVLPEGIDAATRAPVAENRRLPTTGNPARHIPPQCATGGGATDAAEE